MSGNPEPEIKLTVEEATFVVTVLRSSASIVTALRALHETLPGLSPSPIQLDAAVSTMLLADSIEQRLKAQAD